MLLSGCIPGTAALQKVAVRTMQLALEIGALMDAGLLVALPGLVPPGAVTWDTWTWAASVFESRTFASSAMTSLIPGQQEAHVALRLRPDVQTRIAWSLEDGVAGVPPPPRYKCDVGGVPVSQLVFESSDATRLSAGGRPSAPTRGAAP